MCLFLRVTIPQTVTGLSGCTGALHSLTSAIDGMSMDTSNNGWKKYIYRALRKVGNKIIVFAKYDSKLTIYKLSTGPN